MLLLLYHSITEVVSKLRAIMRRAMKHLTIVKMSSPGADRAETNLLESLQKLRVTLDRPIIAAIGGDGTMLRAIKKHRTDDALFVGISTGHLGFLQVVDSDKIQELVEALAAKTYSLITAPMLHVRDKQDQVLGYAFNDISVERNGPRAAKFSVHIGQSIGSFIGDGVIFATPLGSTAYSLAASGPIIDAEAEDVFVVTPNNPHISELYSTLQRPHVLSRNRTVSIDFQQAEQEGRPVQLIVDGVVVQKKLTDSVRISLSDQKVHLIQLSQRGFHDRIEAKRLGRS